MTQWNDAVEPEAADTTTHDPTPTRGTHGSLTAATIAMVITALSSVVIAGASLAVAFHAQHRADERVQELVAAISQQPQQVVVSGSASSHGDDHKNDRNKDEDNKDTATGTARGRIARSGDAAHQAAGNGNAAASDAGDTPAGGNQRAQANQPAAQPAQPAAASIPAATPNVLLNATLASSDNNVSSPQRYYWAVDGPAAGPTLDQVASIRAQAAPPPGMEQLGIGGLSYEIRNVVQTGDTATATLVLVFPGNWGSWEYPNSGFQYVDGEWKLQKSAVCSLAQAAWIGCY